MDIFGEFEGPKSWAEALKQIALRSSRIAKADLTSVQLYQEASLANLATLNSGVRDLRENIQDSFTDIARNMKEAFGTSKPFSEFQDTFSQATRAIEEGRTQLAELANLGMADSKLIGEFEAAALEVESQTERALSKVKAIAEKTAQSEQVPDLEMANFQESYRLYAKSRQDFSKLEDRLKYKLRVAHKVRNSSPSFYRGGIQKSFFALLSGTRDFYHSVTTGNAGQAYNILESFKRNIEEYKSSIEASAEQQKLGIGKGLRAGHSLLLKKTMLAFTGALVPIIEGFEAVLKPMMLFLSGGIFGIVKLIYDIFAAASQFNKQMIENRGLRQFTYDVDLSLSEEAVKAQLESKYTTFKKNMLDTSFNPANFKASTSNIYNITAETFNQIDNLVSNIHLNRVRDELGGALSTNDAQMTLVNEVLTFSKGLGTSYADVAATLEQFTQDSQFSFESASDTFSYISKLAFSGNFSAVRLLSTYRSLQSSMTGLNTRISGTLGLIALLHKAKFMNENSKQKFFADLKSFASDRFTENVTMGIVTQNDLRDIYTFIDSQTIVGNRQADSLYMGELRRAIDNMNDPLLHEGAITNLEHLISQDPTAQYAYSLVNVRKRLLNNIDIFSASSEQLSKFLATNQTLLEDTLGREYRQMGEGLIQLLIRIKKMHGEDVDTLKEILGSLSAKDTETGQALDPKAAAQTEYQNMKANLIRNRDQYTDIFNSWKNMFDDFLAQASSIIPQFFGALVDIFNLSLGRTKYRDVLKSFNEIRDISKRLQDATGEDRANLIRELAEKINETEKQEKKFFEQLGEDPSLQILQDDLNRRRPKINNNVVTADNLQGSISVDALIKYHTEYGIKVISMLEKRKKHYEEKMKKENRVGMSPDDIKKAYEEFKQSPLVTGRKGLENIGLEQFSIIAYTMLGLYNDPKRALEAVDHMLAAGIREADFSSSVGFFEQERVTPEEEAKRGGKNLQPALGKLFASPGLIYPLCQVFSLLPSEYLTEGEGQDIANTREAMMLGLLKAASQVPEVFSILSDTEGEITESQAKALERFHQIMHKETMAAGKEYKSSSKPETWLKGLEKYTQQFREKTKRRVVKVSIKPAEARKYEPLVRYVAKAAKNVAPGASIPRFRSENVLDAGVGPGEAQASQPSQDAVRMLEANLATPPAQETFASPLAFLVEQLRVVSPSLNEKGPQGTRKVLFAEVHVNDVQLQAINENGDRIDLVAKPAIDAYFKKAATLAAKDLINRIN